MNSPYLFCQITSSIPYVINKGLYRGFLNILYSYRTISPVIGGTIWAASLGDASRSFGFPINFHLIFVLLSSVFLICIILVSTLPKSIDKQKKRPEDDCNANNRKAKTETENS